MSWIQSNILDRTKNPNCDFKVTMCKSNFDKVSLDEASNNISYTLKDKKLVVSYSGGYDSEYIVKKLYQLKIEFIPIVVCVEGLEDEAARAFDFLNSLSIEYKVVKVSKSEFIDIYYKHIFKKLNGSIPAITQYVACNYAKDLDAIYVNGCSSSGDGETLVQNMNYYFTESSFYHYAWMPEEKICNFFMHTPQIAYSFLNELNDTDITWAQAKCRVYDLPYREKTYIRKGWSPEVEYIVINLLEQVRKHRSNPRYYVGDKKSYMSQISD